MPTITRTRTIPAAPERVWEIATDPLRLPEWWPRVQRVEDADELAWTTVLESSRGRAVRADYTLVEAQRPLRITWRQELAESPFERILADSETDIELEPRGAGGTLVRLRERLTTRGWSRFGGIQMRLATRRKLDRALDGLEAIFAPGSRS